MSIVDIWNEQREQARIDFFVAAFEAGHGIQFTSEPSTSAHPGNINGFTAIPSHTPYARYVAERAERRTSTASVPTHI